MSGFGRTVPPSWEHVKIYFLEKQQSPKNARAFFDYYSVKKWLNSNGNTLTNWKALAWQWILNNK